VDGTSASAALAGLISLINQKRISAYDLPFLSLLAWIKIVLVCAHVLRFYQLANRRGKKQLGFLNPILYQMAVNKPTAFTDITTGTIKGTMGYTCQYGWTATAGWDPASGVRSPLSVIVIILNQAALTLPLSSLTPPLS
jgi:hypothetical protein